MQHEIKISKHLPAIPNESFQAHNFFFGTVLFFCLISKLTSRCGTRFSRKLLRYSKFYIFKNMNLNNSYTVFHILNNLEYSIQKYTKHQKRFFFCATDNFIFQQHLTVQSTIFSTYHKRVDCHLSIFTNVFFFVYIVLLSQVW